MRKICFALLLMAAALPAIPADPPADGPARIRIAGIFIAGFNVWKQTADAPRCSASGKPWLNFECGFFKCPKPKSLGIPLDLDYTNWRNSPRYTEVEVEADKPLAMHFIGNFARGMGDQVRVSLCEFDVKFTPRAGAMYEASLDPSEDAMFGGGGPPPEDGRCRLRLTEIKMGENGIHERFLVEGGEVSNCLK